MSRDLSGTYTLPENTQAITGETLSSVKYNAINDDIAAALNAPWPASAGFEQAIVQSLPTTSDMATATLTDSEVVTVTGGYSGDPETFIIDTDSTLTPNGTTVIALTGVSGNAVSTRTEYVDFAEMNADTRSHAANEILTIKGLSGFYKVVTASPTFTTSAGLKLLFVPLGYVSFNHFGVVGDGVADDTVAIKAALSLGGTVKTDSGTSTYLVSDTLTPTIPTDFDLCGSKLLFKFTSLLPGYYIKSDNCKIANGSIEIQSTVTSGGNGHALNCVTAGNQSDGTGYKNLNITNLTVKTERTDAGAHIGIIGECSNVLIQNITVPDNALCRNIIGCEWGGTTLGGTGHPHDITISNINIGAMTYPSYGGGGYGYGVWLSAAFNVKVENLTMESGHGLVMVTRGDNANTYAPTKYKNRVGRGITVDNATIGSFYGYAIRVVGSYGHATLSNIDCDVDFNNVYAGGGKVGANNNFGMRFENCKGVTVDNFVMNGVAASGVFTGGPTEGVDLRNLHIEGSEIYGASISNGAKRLSISNSKFIGNNSNAGASASTPAILFADATDCSITDIDFSEDGAAAETQKYSFYCTNAAVRPRINGCRVHAQAAGGVGFLIGSAANTTILATGRDNTADASVTTPFGGAAITD